MKILSNRTDVRERGRRTSTDDSFTSRFVARNLRALDATLKAARMSLRRGKNVAIRTHTEFRRAIAEKRSAQ